LEIIIGLNAVALFSRDSARTKSKIIKRHKEKIYWRRRIVNPTRCSPRVVILPSIYEYATILTYSKIVNLPSIGRYATYSTESGII